jgi:serine/threonine protein kinase
MNMFAGGYARVCLCLHEPSGQYFALKMLSSDGVARANQVEHVQCEMDILQVVETVDNFL